MFWRQVTFFLKERGEDTKSIVVWGQTIFSQKQWSVKKWCYLTIDDKLLRVERVVNIFMYDHYLILGWSERTFIKTIFILNFFICINIFVLNAWLNQHLLEYFSKGWLCEKAFDNLFYAFGHVQNDKTNVTLFTSRLMTSILQNAFI